MMIITAKECIGRGTRVNKQYIYITRKLASESVEGLREQFEVNMWDSEERPVPRHDKSKNLVIHERG